MVSGGAGFIGSHLVDALVARGDEVTVIDDLSTGRGENIAEAIGRGAKLVPADVTDRATGGGSATSCGPSGSCTSPLRSTCGSRWATRA